MSRIKKILLAILVVIIVIQFIRPVRNKSDQVLPSDISKLFTMPDSVLVVFKNACYDCHSNNTNYPWYINIQPMGWIMTKHIQRGKVALNFSDFGSFSIRKQQSKLKAIADQVTDGEMPLSSYTWMHKKARLTKDEKTLLINWVQKSKDSLLKN